MGKRKSVSIVEGEKEALFSLPGIIFLSFLAGAAVYAFEVFPYKYLRTGFTAAVVLYERYIVNREVNNSFLWEPVTHPEKGLAKYKRDEPAPGIVIFACIVIGTASATLYAFLAHVLGS